MPADHEAQSQVKTKRRAAAGVKAFKESLTQKKDEVSHNSQRWVSSTCKQEREESSTHVKESHV